MFETHAANEFRLNMPIFYVRMDNRNGLRLSYGLLKLSQNEVFTICI